jgi:hypothetical protein
MWWGSEVSSKRLLARVPARRSDRYATPTPQLPARDMKTRPSAAGPPAARPGAAVAAGAHAVRDTSPGAADFANACPKQAPRSRRLQVACADAAVSRSLRAPVPRRATAASAADRPPRAPGLRSRAGRPRPGGERADVDHSKRHVARHVAPQRPQLTAGPLSRSTPAPLRSSCFGRAAPPAAVPIECLPGADSVRVAAAGGAPQRSQTRSPPDSTAPVHPVDPVRP